MAYWLIALAILIIAAPIISLIPSKRQKALVAMRAEARKRGVTVSLGQIEDPDPNPEKYISGTGRPLERILKVATYRRPRRRPENWRDLPPLHWSLVRDGQSGRAAPATGWSWGPEGSEHLSAELRALLIGVLPDLPADVMRIEEQQYMVSLHWHERVEASEVGRVLDVIDQIVNTDPLPPIVSDGPQDSPENWPHERF